jgi:hypothetical protein
MMCTGGGLEHKVLRSKTADAGDGGFERYAKILEILRRQLRQRFPIDLVSRNADT